MSDIKIVSGEPPEPCGEVDEVFGPGLGPVCTREKGHDGCHEANCPMTGRHVSTWRDLPVAPPEGAGS